MRIGTWKDNRTVSPESESAQNGMVAEELPMSATSHDRRILVLGGTGHYGRHIVGSLIRKHFRVRILTRDKSSARKILGDRVEIVQGDVTSNRSIEESVQGSSGIVISLSAFTPKLIRKLYVIERDAVLTVLEQAKRASISRIVYLSAYELRKSIIETFDLEIARVKLEVETALSQSGFHWTILGVAASMEIFFAMLRGRKMIVPGGGPPALPTVSPVDVGEIAAQTIVREDLSGKRIRVTGPEAMSFPEAALCISGVIGRRLEIRKLPLLPLRIAAMLTRPFNPFIHHLVGSVMLMNSFPPDLAAQVPQDHQRLIDTFDYTPTTLEMEAHRRFHSTLPA